MILEIEVAVLGVSGLLIKLYQLWKEGKIFKGVWAIGFMANEAIIRDRLQSAIDMNVTDSLGFEKGTIMKLSGARLVAASASTDVFGGILAREKIAADGRTQVAVYFDGVFDCLVRGTNAVGTLLVVSGANILGKAVEADMITGKVVGKLLQASGAGDTVDQVKLIGQ